MLTVESTINTNSASSSALSVAGGAWIVKNLYVGGSTVFASTSQVRSDTDSTSTSTGALTVTGGVGIGKNVQVGGYLGVLGNAVITGSAGNTLEVNGQTKLYNKLEVSGNTFLKGTYVDGDLNIDGYTLYVDTIGSFDAGEVTFGDDVLVNGTLYVTEIKETSGNGLSIYTSESMGISASEGLRIGGEVNFGNDVTLQGDLYSSAGTDLNIGTRSLDDKITLTASNIELNANFQDGKIEIDSEEVDIYAVTTIRPTSNQSLKIKGNKGFSYTYTNVSGTSDFQPTSWHIPMALNHNPNSASLSLYIKAKSTTVSGEKCTISVAGYSSSNSFYEIWNDYDASHNDRGVSFIIYPNGSADNAHITVYYGSSTYTQSTAYMRQKLNGYPGVLTITPGSSGWGQLNGVILYGAVGGVSFSDTVAYWGNEGTSGSVTGYILIQLNNCGIARL